ncbi:MAG: hypothetical protein KFB93_06960 [Simkaniaceae bacterium]|nr:MAG: hypothetical protein KFB93_06960 [Simkaniaceae bacterium]
MKKVTFLLLGTLMIAGGLLVSCQKKTPPCHPKEMGDCHPCKPVPPCHPKEMGDCHPCKPVPPSQPKKNGDCHPCKPDSGPCKRY